MTEEEVRALLEGHQVPYQEWGTGGSKTLEHLMREVTNMECQLVAEASAVIRILTASIIRICAYRPTTGQYVALQETSRVYADGRDGMRPLRGSIAEKMVGRERARPAAHRGLQEELKIRLKKHDRHHLRAKEKTIMRVESTTFPGLITENRGSFFDLCLPPEYFREKYVERQSDKTTTFGWVPWDERSWAPKD